MAKRHPMSLAFDSWRLGWEAWIVIGLRLPRLMTGDGAAMVEAQRMVAEKVQAAGELQWRAMTGTLGATPQAAMAASVAHYSKAVRRNRRRLTRG